MTNLIKRMTQTMNEVGYTARERFNVFTGALVLPLLQMEASYAISSSNPDLANRITHAITEGFYILPITTILGLGLGLASASQLMFKRKSELTDISAKVTGVK
jgi:hypothetical protein